MYVKTDLGFDADASKHYNGYVADTFDELPSDAPFGSEAKYIKETDGVVTGIGVAVKFLGKWVNEDGEALGDIVPVKIAPVENGTVSAQIDSTDVTEGRVGETVTITATAAEGYSLASLIVNGEAFVSGDTHTLTLAGVTVVAVFEETPADPEPEPAPDAE